MQVEPKFAASDLESQGGRFHTVTCLDVMIHYPQVLLGHAHWSCASSSEFVLGLVRVRCSQRLAHLHTARLGCVAFKVQAC